MMIEKYAESIYAGVLGKLIGVYLGRPVEGWPYEKIQRDFDEIHYFVHKEVGVPLIVADDDISGTFGFFKAMEDNQYSRQITAKDIGDTWLNYIIEDKTILWWGGLGRSTEHTAYLRLKNGIPAPESGSIKRNGQTIAEQIGAQIFIDAFAMMSPGDPDQAVALIQKAASVSHDGIAVEAACFLGAMEALAFDIKAVDDLFDGAMKYVSSSLLKQVIEDVRTICTKESDWRKVRAWLDQYYGYGQFPGPCHMVPNHAMVLASLLLGGDDFQRSIMIAASAGWDTDCNAGNVGCLNGIRLKLDGIAAGADFRTPVADMMYVVTADGGSCVTDAVQQTRAILRTGAAYRQEDVALCCQRYGFEFWGSTQGFTPCPYTATPYPVAVVSNSNEQSGINGLAIDYQALAPGINCCVSTPVYLDFANTAQNFATLASPTLYSSQTVIAHVQTNETENPALRFYILFYDVDDQVKRLDGDAYALNKGVSELSWQVPDTGGMPIFRLGVELLAAERLDGRIVILDMDWQGAPQNFVQSGMLMTSIWSLNPGWLQAWVSSAKHFAPDFKYTYCISHSEDEGLVTIGTQDWADYAVSSSLSFNLHQSGGLVVRSKGHRRYYAAVLMNGDTAVILMRKNDEVKRLAAATFHYVEDVLYDLTFVVQGNALELWINGEPVLKTVDTESHYVCGAVGFLVEQGTILADGFCVRQVTEAS